MMESVSLCSVFLHHVRTQWGGGKPGHGLSPGTKVYSTLTLDSQLPELWEINACCLSHSVYGIWLKQPTLTKTCALPHPPYPPATPTFLCVRTFSLRHAFPAHVMNWKCWGITLLGNNGKWGLCINTLIAGCDNSEGSILHWLSKWAHRVELQMPIVVAG